MNQPREAFTLEEIVIPSRLRGRVNEDSVVSLMESIKRIGLRTPLTVRWDKDVDNDDAIVLVAGRHRLEACKRLGMDLVDCIVFDGTETEARLWEIAENLHRADLTAVERAEHIAEWIRLAAESPAQNAPVKSRRVDGRGGSIGQGINAASRELGVERTEAQRATKIAALPDEVRQKAREEDWSQSKLLATVRPHPEPLNDVETEEQWMSAIMRVWNRGAPQWRERFIETVARPVFDNTSAA